MRIFSGIQPTGRKHLGNYIGAIAQYISSQERGEGIFCIVDLHAITVAYDPGELRERLHDTTAILLAAGLDPARMHQFRDKSLAQRELVSAGLLLYPVLMAADVLAYRAHEVPVGEDQREHLELMRDVARRINQRYGEGLLIVPEDRIPEVGARIMDLQDPTTKMSTTSGSEQGTVYVLDEPKAIQKKISSAVTDSGSEVRRDPDKPGISNLLEILAAIRGSDADTVAQDFAQTRYGEFKKAVAEEVIEYLAPVRERYAELRADEEGLAATLARGAEQAAEIADPIVAEVRRAMGFGAAAPPGSAGTSGAG